MLYPYFKNDIIQNIFQIIIMNELDKHYLLITKSEI